MVLFFVSGGKNAIGALAEYITNEQVCLSLTLNKRKYDNSDNFNCLLLL